MEVISTLYPIFLFIPFVILLVLSIKFYIEAIKLMQLIASKGLSINYRAVAKPKKERT